MSVADVLWLLWRHKILFLAVYALVVAGGVVKLLITPPTYTVNAIIIAAEEAGAAVPGSQLKGLGALLNANAGGGRLFEKFREVLFSTDVSRRLQEKHGYLQQIYADQWVPESKSWDVEPKTINGYFRFWFLDLLGRDPSRPPDEHNLLEYIKRQFSMSQNGDGTSWTMRFSDQSSEFAAVFLKRLFIEANEIIREQEIDTTRQYVAYAEKRMRNIENAEYRAVLARLFSEQEKKLMILSINVPVAAEMVVEPEPTPYPTGPLVTFTLMIALLLGPFAGVGVVFLRVLFEHMRRELLARQPI